MNHPIWLEAAKLDILVKLIDALPTPDIAVNTLRPR